MQLEKVRCGQEVGQTELKNFCSPLCDSLLHKYIGGKLGSGENFCPTELSKS